MEGLKWVYIMLYVMDTTCVINSPGMFWGTVSDFLLRDGM